MQTTASGGDTGALPAPVPAPGETIPGPQATNSSPAPGPADGSAAGGAPVPGDIATAPAAGDIAAAPIYTPPRLLHDVPPAYPDEARLRGWEGRIVLKFLVTTGGRVEEVTVVQSSGHAILDRAAVTAARQWLYAPARRGDLAVEARLRRSIRFQLQ